MPVIGSRELAREAKDVLDKLEETGEPVIVTRYGKPIATLTAVGEERVDELVVAMAPMFKEAEREADEAIASGTTKDIDDVELFDEDEAEATELLPYFTRYSFSPQPLGVWCNKVRQTFVEEVPVAEADPAQQAQVHELKEQVFALYFQQALQTVEVQLHDIDQRIVTRVDASPGMSKAEAYTEMLKTVATGKSFEVGAPSSEERGFSARPGKFRLR